MSPCQRFEELGALRLEAGSAPDGHEESCADCQAARGEHLRVADAMRNLPPVALPEGWAEGIRARIAPAKQEQPAWWRWTGLAGGLAVAAAVLLIARCGTGDARTAQNSLPTLDQEVRSTAVERRAGSAVIGDTLVARGSAPANTTRELRVYVGSWGNAARLVARCPGSDGCKVDGDKLELGVRLGEPGVYRSLLFVGAAPVPVTGSLDGDARAAEAAGVTVEVSVMTEVD